MTTRKTYRRDEDGTLHYREAWKEGKIFVQHFGKVGTKGKVSNRSVRTRTWPNNPTYTEQMAEFLEQAAHEGYREFDDTEIGWLVLQIWADPEDSLGQWALNEAGNLLDQKFGWLGLGHYDGHDVGGIPPLPASASHTKINLFCRAVDTALGAKALRSFATEHDLKKTSLIADREPGETSEYVLSYSPTKKISTFEL